MARRTSPQELVTVESEPNQVNQEEDKESSVPALDVPLGMLHQGEHKGLNKTKEADEESQTDGFASSLEACNFQRE